MNEIANSAHRLRKNSLDKLLMESVLSANLAETLNALACGANPNSKNDQNVTVLEVAIRAPEKETSIEIISAILNHGADPNLTLNNVDDKTMSSPFMVACMRGNEKVITAMLESTGPIKVDLLKVAETQWMSSMSIACSSSSVTVMEKTQNFFEKNILSQESMTSQFIQGHLWLTSDSQGRNAFMHTDYAINKRWILDQNFADEKSILEKKDERGRTALWISVIENNQKCVEFLLGRGARTDVVNSEGDSLLEMSSKYYPLIRHTAVSKNILGLLRAVDASQKAMDSINEIVESSKNTRSTPS